MSSCNYVSKIVSSPYVSLIVLVYAGSINALFNILINEDQKENRRIVAFVV